MVFCLFFFGFSCLFILFCFSDLFLRLLQTTFEPTTPQSPAPLEKKEFLADASVPVGTKFEIV